MNKDEMKNKISMALKDPILQQGFEIICKENAELKKQNTNANLKGLEMQIAKDSHRDRARKAHNQLTKAKDIIKDYMIIVQGVTVCSVPEENRCIDVLKLNKQAKQFLKETEQ